MNGILKSGSFEQYLKIGQLKKGFNKLEFKFLMIKIIKEAQEWEEKMSRRGIV